MGGGSRSSAPPPPPPPPPKPVDVAPARVEAEKAALLNTIKMLYQADRELKNHFSKQSDFILFLENYLCTEFKSCKKESSKRLYGYYIKQDYEDEDEENL